MSFNISLTPHLESFIEQQITTGRYPSASEVVQTALQLLEQREESTDACMTRLKHEIDRGIVSGPGDPVTSAFWNGLRNELRNESTSPGDA
jgi:antitoxin ParD1/3/4